MTVSQQTKARTKAGGRSVVLERQEAISADYRKLANLAQVRGPMCECLRTHILQYRHRVLSDGVKLFKFFDECDAFESWAKETEQRLQEQTPIDHIEAFRRKFNVSI